MEERKMSKKAILLLLAVCVILFSSACGVTETNSNVPSESQVDDATSQNNSLDTFVAEVKVAIRGAINSDEENIVDVVLKNGELCVKVDLSKANPTLLTMEDLAISRTGSITDAILELTDYDNQWETITVDFGDIGKITKNKDDMVETEFGRYFPFEKLTLE
jgi:hypothetical protein